MNGIGRLHLRRSAGLGALLAGLVLVELHIFGRGRIWAHEWLWAFYQYHFVTVLLGPPSAGVAAWEGQRVARSGEVTAASGATLRAAVLAWASVYAWVLIAYAVGLATVVTLVRMAGTPGWPDRVSVSTVGPAVALLAAETAIGFMVGRLVRSPLVPPVVAVGCFLVVLFFYISGPARLVDVGGASGSLLGLAPRSELQAAQILLYLSLTLAAFLGLLWAQRAPGVMRAGATIVALAVVGVTGRNVVAQGPDSFREADVPLVCVGTRPEVCVGPGYRRLAPAVRDILLPYVEELEAAGAPVPERFAQGALRGEGSAPIGTLVFHLIRYGQAQAESTGPFEIVNWYAGDSCDLVREPASTAFDGVAFWLLARVHPEHVVAPLRPPVLSRGTLEEQRAWIRDAVRVLMACGR